MSYYWVTTRWKTVLPESKMLALAEEVNSTPELPSLFDETYDKLYPGQRFVTMQENLLHIALSLAGAQHHVSRCECSSLSMQSFIRFTDPVRETDDHGKTMMIISGHSQYFLGWGLQKYASPAKCFDYNIHAFVEEFKRSPKALAELLQTPLSEMNEVQVLEFYLLMQAPSIYDKYRNPDRFEQGMKRMKDKLGR